MVSRARALIGPCYLFACVLLGGSAQGVWSNMLLQLAGVAVIAWAAMAKADQPLSRSARQLLLLAAAGILVAAVQLIPLPAALWATLPGRAGVARGFAALGMAVPSEPLSLAPASTLDAILTLIPPLAVFCALACLKAYRPLFLAIAVLGATIAGIGLGALQVASNGAELSGWYLYPETNQGRAVGFFANADHMATLLVIAIPFLAAIVAASKGGSRQRYLATATVAAGTAVLLLVGIVLNGSLAGYGLAVPVAAASFLILLPPAMRLRLWVGAGAVLLLIAAVAILQAKPVTGGAIGAHANSAVSSRSEILKTTAAAARSFMPFGSGLGTFRAVYPLYESAATVDSTYVIHAHNDYAELLLELGAAGAVLILLFLAWWAAAVWRVWSSSEARPFVRAAAIASAAILVHSLVDFPLRTAAIAACFAMTLALLADGRGPAPQQDKALRRNRHVEFR